LIAPVQIDARDRVLRAAVEWVYDQGCSNALADLEDAVCDLIGRNIDGTPLKTLRGDLLPHG
jgi:hypothetical protein